MKSNSICSPKKLVKYNPSKYSSEWELDFEYNVYVFRELIIMYLSPPTLIGEVPILVWLNLTLARSCGL